MKSNRVRTSTPQVEGFCSDTDSALGSMVSCIRQIANRPSKSFDINHFINGSETFISGYAP